MNSNEETESKQDGVPWTYATAPADKKYKWDFYFRDAPKHIRENIQMDEEGTYSVTDMVSAKRTTLLIRDKLREILGIAGNDGSILDGCACIGGNTISFAQYFRKVTAIELSQARCRMLEHNLELFQLRQNVEIIEGDFTKVVPSLPKFDVIFLDPPWGGERYHESNVLDISLGGRPLVEVCNSLIGRASILALKLPTNFNIVPFRHHLDSRCRILTESNKIRKTLIILIALPDTKPMVQAVDGSSEPARSPVDERRSCARWSEQRSNSSFIPPLLQPNTLKRASHGGYDLANTTSAQQSSCTSDAARGAMDRCRFNNDPDIGTDARELNTRKRKYVEQLQALPESINDVSNADHVKRMRQASDAANQKDHKSFPDHL